MAKTQYYTAATIDGYIADADNSLGWLFEAASGRGTSPFDAFFAGVGAFVMGSTTYEWVLENESLLDQPQKWASWYGNKPAWVFTHRRLPTVAGATVTFVSGDVRPVHAAMAAAAAVRTSGSSAAGSWPARSLTPACSTS